jgi:hypothetical protein
MKSKLSLGLLFSRVKFVGSIDVPYDTHVLGAKHHVIKWIHQL